MSASRATDLQNSMKLLTQLLARPWNPRPYFTAMKNMPRYTAAGITAGAGY